MNIDVLLINLIIVLFPILTNAIYQIYINDLEKKENLFLDITLVSSVYLLYSLGNYNVFMIFVTSIFLISLLEKRIFVSFIIFFITCLNSFDLIIIFEYLIFYFIYILYYKFSRKKLFIDLFIFFKILFIIMFYINNSLGLLNSFFVSIIFVLTCYLIINSIKIVDDIVSLNITLKELEKEKRLKDSLFKITHEIKNPIAVCKSYLDMFDFNNKDHEKYIGILKEEVNNILVLLQDFSSMSNIKINEEILDINLLLEEVTRQFKPILNKNNIKFEVNILNDEVYIKGDYNRLNQVFVNVIKNAIEARDENKKSFIKLNTDIIDNNFVITIFDNGVGIKKDLMDKIKEPFYTTKKNGTGLGVSLSLQIIKAHGGKMEFVSTDKVSTSVIITLPIT